MTMPGIDPKPSFLESISPWATSRSATPQSAPETTTDAENLKQTTGQDHVTSFKKRLSSLRYPEDCPPLQTKWFYAVDTPKSKPAFTGLGRTTEPKPLPPAKKFIPFFGKDSQSIEKAFQQLLQQEAKETTQSESNEAQSRMTIKVPVNEDYLYDVDVEKRELSPAYWLGPVYEVRRGTWFFQEGSVLKPCEENLATQLEEGYLKLKPWQSQYSQDKSKSVTALPEAKAPPSESSSPQGAADKIVGDESKLTRDRSDSQGRPGTPVQTLPMYRLFGSYMNSTVTYQDSTVAWLNYDDFMSRVSSTVYQRFGAVGGTKVVRGYVEPGTQKEASDGKATPVKDSPPPTPTTAARIGGKEGDQPSQDKSTTATDPNGHEPLALKSPSLSTGHRATLQRQMSSLNGQSEDTAKLEEEARKQEEREMEDSRESGDEERDRQIDHVILVTHGIGQRLGLRLDSINFIHDVSTLRKTMKSVYAASPDLQSLNSPFPDAKKNTRVQVLPVLVLPLLHKIIETHLLT